MSITHKTVVNTYYSIVLNTSNRGMPRELNKFLEGFDIEPIGDAWYDCKTELRDYEGDFEGIKIYAFCPELDGLYRFIADKIGVEYSVLEGLDIHITNI